MLFEPDIPAAYTPYRLLFTVFDVIVMSVELLGYMVRPQAIKSLLLMMLFVE
jgi:NADH:ubiquinone oxidoreductase subunit 3 (subunit A)